MQEFAPLLHFLPLLHFVALKLTEPSSANELADFFTDAMDWGIAAAKGYLGYLAITALAVYLFRG